MSTGIEKAENLLVPIEIESPAEIFAAGGTDQIVAAIEAKARSLDLDISTERGRKEVASVARKIASSKTLLDDAGKNFVAAIKDQAKVIDAERKRMRDSLDALKDEIRKPLTDWEERDKRRIEGHERVLTQMCELVQFDRPPDVGHVENRLAMLLDLYQRDWEEFEDRARKVYRNAQSSLNERLVAAEKAEAEAAELARLRAEAAERAQRERDERVAREAAEKARVEAERKAAQEAEQQRLIELTKHENAKRAAREEAQRAERALANAEERAKREEAFRIAEEKRLTEARVFAEKAAKEADLRAKKAEEDKAAIQNMIADQKRVAIAEATVVERKRAAAEKRAAEQEAEWRKEDEAHRGRIDTEALDAIHAALGDWDSQITGSIAGRILEAIKRDKIPHVSITY